MSEELTQLCLVKIAAPQGWRGYLRANMRITEDDKLLLTVRQPCRQLGPLKLSSRPLPKGSLVVFSYEEQDTGRFELWSGELGDRIMRNGEEEQVYQVSKLHQEMSHDERSAKRHYASNPLSMFLDENREWCFGGCQISSHGLTIWAPPDLAKHIRPNQEYEFLLSQGEEDRLLVATCCHEPAQDKLGGGYVFGFAFPQGQSFEALDIKDISNWHMDLGHPLSVYNPQLV